MAEPASYTRLRHLQTISEAALAHLEFDDLVSELLVRLRTILNADTAAVLLLDPDANELVARAAKGLEAEVEAQVRVPLGRGFAGRIAAERRAIVIPDIDAADIFNPILREIGLRSLLGVPLLVEGRVTGVLHIGTLTPREFTADDAELLQAAADRIALAIDHARLYDDERRARSAAEETAEQLRRVEAVTDTALAHMELDELLESLLVRVRELIASDTATVHLVSSDRTTVGTRAAVGLEAAPGDVADVPVGEGFTGRIAAEGRPLVVEDVAGGGVSTSALGGAALASLVGVPLIVAGTVTGVLGAGTWERREFSSADVALLERAADRIALAIENARLYGAERAARAEAERAADWITRIESIAEVALHHITLDDAVVESLLTRVREALDADSAALLVADDETQVLVARAADGDVRHDVERGIEVPIGRGFAGTIAATREPMVVEDAAEVEIVSPLLRERGMRSLLGVPLAVEGRLLGVLFVGTLKRRRFGADDLALLELAGERLAVALDHSQMYERERHVAETLQRSLLPESLPDVAGAQAAAQYLPGAGEAVGGDWYDVVPLDDGRLVLAMGDVVSRGVKAAAAMGQLRNALRAYVLEDSEPAAVLERLDALVGRMDGREMVTLAYAVLDPVDGSVSYVAAGHPPPLMLVPGGEVSLLDEGRGPPLGAQPGAVYAPAHVQLDPGATLLLYTDGIVERRDMWVDEGIERLTAAAREADAAGPGALLEKLVAALLPDGRAPDDVALLAVRLDAEQAGPLRLSLPADPTVLISLRRSLRRWLDEAGAGEEATHDVLVATTEAAANAVEHAYGPEDASFSVEARADSDGAVTVIVRDSGAWRPPRGHNRGRGTMLMQALMDEFEVATGDAGTEVRMCKHLGRSAAAA